MPSKKKSAAKSKAAPKGAKNGKAKKPVKASKVKAVKASAKAIKAPKVAKAAAKKPVAKASPKVEAKSLKQAKIAEKVSHQKPATKGKAEVAIAKTPKPKGAATPTALSAKSLAMELIKEQEEAEIVLTNADGLRYCKVSECDELATSDAYCRYHYLLNWKKIQVRKKILAGDKLDRYIEELTSRYPDKYLEMIKKDLASEKDFMTAIQELEIDGSGEDVEVEDDARNYIDEVRGVGVAADDDEY